MISLTRFHLSPLEKFLLATVIGLSVMRWILAGVTELTPDEALLQEWARHPSPSGYEGGSGAMWVAKAGPAIFGHTTWAARVVAPWLAGMACWGIYRLARSMGGEKSAAWAVALTNITPWFNIGAIQIQPSTLAAYGGLGTMIALWRALRRAGRWDCHWWLAGLAMAGALWCDWAALWLPVGALSCMAFSRHWRGRLKSPGPWLMLLVFIVLGPLPLWHLSNGDGGGLASGLATRWTGASWGAHPSWQLIVAIACGLSPVLLLGVIWAAREHWRQPLSDIKAASHLLIAFCLPAGVGALAFSLTGSGQSSLLATAALPALVLLAVYWENAPPPPRLKQSLQWLGVFFAMGMSLLALHSDIARHLGVPLSFERDPARLTYGWKSAADEMDRMIQEVSGAVPEGLFLIAGDENLASALNFYLPETVPVFRATPAHPLVHVVESPLPSSSYYYWPRYDEESSPGVGPFMGRTALYVTRSDSDVAPGAISRAFRQVTIMQVFDITRHGQRVMRMKVFACYDYVGLPL